LLLALILFRCEDDRSAPTAEFINPLVNPLSGPPAGNPDGNSPVPVEAGPIDVSDPDYIVGNGTPESCTGEAFRKAVAHGGKIVFNCGPKPVTITLDKPVKVYNDSSGDIRIDNSVIHNNAGGSWYPVYPGISMHSDTKCMVTNSTIE